MTMHTFSSPTRQAVRDDSVHFKLHAQRHGDLERLNELPHLLLSFQSGGRLDPGLNIQGRKSPYGIIWRTQAEGAFRTVPKYFQDLLTFRFFVSGSLHRRSGRGEFVGQKGMGMLLPFDDVQEMRYSDHFEALNCSFDLKMLMTCDRLLHGEGGFTARQFEPLVDMRTPALRALSLSLRSVLDRLDTEGDSQDFLWRLAEELLLYQLLAIWPRKNGKEKGSNVAPATRAVRLACEFINANLSSPISIAEVANAAGIGVRSLQIGFRREINRTPVQYIIERRLDCAHADLAAPNGESVSEIARRWGFVHMSDFSRRYRQRFNCSPSDTKLKGLRKR